MKNMKPYFGLISEEKLENCHIVHGGGYIICPIGATEIDFNDLEEGEKVCAGDGENYCFLLQPKKPKLMTFKEAKTKAFNMFPEGYISVYFDNSRYSDRKSVV